MPDPDKTALNEITISGASWTIDIPPRLRRDLRRYYLNTALRHIEMAGVQTSGITDTDTLEEYAEGLADQAIAALLSDFRLRMTSGDDHPPPLVPQGDPYDLATMSADEVLTDLLPGAVARQWDSDDFTNIIAVVRHEITGDINVLLDKFRNSPPPKFQVVADSKQPIKD